MSRACGTASKRSLWHARRRVSFFLGLPVTLAGFCAAGAIIYLAGAMVVPETKGKFA